MVTKQQLKVKGIKSLAELLETIIYFHIYVHHKRIVKGSELLKNIWEIYCSTIWLFDTSFRKGRTISYFTDSMTMILFSFCFTNQTLLLTAIIIIWMVFVYFVTANVKHFEMSRRGQTYFEQHFFFSNRPVQFFMGQSSYQSSYDQLFALCAVIVFVLPLIVHQVNMSILNIFAVVLLWL